MLCGHGERGRSSHAQNNHGAKGNTDDGYFVAQLGFSVSVYGVVESEITIGTNGYVTFGTEHFAYGNNEEIPFVTYVDGIVAPFWIDLDLSSSGEVRYQAMGDSFVVSWLNVPTRQVRGATTNARVEPLVHSCSAHCLCR